MTEEQTEIMEATIRAARTRAEAVKDFDEWLASIRARLDLMQEEVGADLALRKILAMLLLDRVTVLMETVETFH